MTDLEERIQRALAAIADDVDGPADLAAVRAAVTTHAPQAVVPRRPERRPLWLAAAAIAVGLAGVWTIAYRAGGRSPSTSTARSVLVAPLAKTVDGFGTITVTPGDDGELCWSAQFGTGSAAWGCTDAATYEAGRSWNATTSPAGAVLFGFAPVDQAVQVEIDGRTIVADADGFWWTTLTGDETSFVIVTADDRYDERLSPPSTTGATVTTAVATTVEPETTVIPTTPPGVATGAVAPAADRLPAGFVPTQASTYEAPPIAVADAGEPTRLRTTIVRYAADRATITAFVSFDVGPALTDGDLPARFGVTSDTGERIGGHPLLRDESGGQRLWREPDRTVSINQGPSRLSDAELAVLASSMHTRADGAVAPADLHDGWTPVEVGTNLFAPQGTQWRLAFSGPESTAADPPELLVTRTAGAQQPAEAGLLDVYGAHAIDVGGQRMIVITRPFMLRRTVEVVWDGTDGWQTRVEYWPVDDLRPLDDLERTAVEIARSLEPVTDAAWAALAEQAEANRAQQMPASWMPGVLAANGLTARGEATAIPMWSFAYSVPVTRADGTTTICEVQRRRLVACHDTSPEGATLVDPQTVRIATTDPAAKHASVISPGGTVGATLGDAGDGVNVAYAPVDPTGEPPQCVELRDDDNQPVGTIAISPATACPA